MPKDCQGSTNVDGVPVMPNFGQYLAQRGRVLQWFQRFQRAWTVSRRTCHNCRCAWSTRFAGIDSAGLATLCDSCRL